MVNSHVTTQKHCCHTLKMHELQVLLLVQKVSPLKCSCHLAGEVSAAYTCP